MTTINAKSVLVTAAVRTPSWRAGRVLVGLAAVVAAGGLGYAASRLVPLLDLPLLDVVLLVAVAAVAGAFGGYALVVVVELWLSGRRYAGNKVLDATSRAPKRGAR